MAEKYYSVRNQNGKLVGTTTNPAELPKGYHAREIGSTIMVEAIEEYLDDLATVEHVCHIRLQKYKFTNHVGNDTSQISHSLK